MKRIIFYIVLTDILVVVYTAYAALQRSEEMLDRYRQEETYKIEQNLKNFVDVAYSTIDSNYKISMDKEYLEKYYGYRLKNIIDVAETIFKLKMEEVNNGTLTLEKAQAEVIKKIQQIRYNEGNGYIWISDTTLPYPKMIMHPLEPSLNGQTMDDPKYNCAMGKEQNLFLAFAEIVRKQGEGFVDYLWPKLTTKGITIDVPKLSYVRIFPRWNWIIGTDFDVDRAIRDGMEKSKKELREMRYDNGIGFFWINNMDESAPQFYMYPIAASIENIVFEGGSLDQLGEVIKSFIKICKEKGSGYVKYKWDKPILTGAIKDVPRLSYVKLYEPLGWVIGTAVYMDKIDKFVAGEKAFLNRQVLLLIFDISVVSVVFIFLLGVQYYFELQYFSEKKSGIILFEESTVPQKAEALKTTIAKSAPFGKTATTVQKAEQSQQETADYLKNALDLSQIMLAQSKLLAFTATLQATQSNTVDKQSEIASEVEQLTEQFDHIAENVQKMADKVEK
jgi:methyl-accepting chemotaxis protein